jgi:hypothetical protein
VFVQSFQKVLAYYSGLYTTDRPSTILKISLMLGHF